MVRLIVTPARGAEVSVAGAPWRRLAGPEALVLPAERTSLRVRNPACCVEEERAVAPGPVPDELRVDLAFAPGAVTPRCARTGVTAQVSGRAWTLGVPAPIPITNTMGRSKVTVTFTDGADYLDEQRIDVRYKQDLVVTCRD
jgi:hypothetical protein